MSDWSFETRAIHSGFNRDTKTGATSVPIYQTAAFGFDSAEDIADVFQGRKFGHVYSRISNPTVSALELRFADLEGGLGAVAVASGMAALISVIQTLAKAGDRIVASRSLFGGTIHLLEDVLSQMGMGVDWVEATDLAAFAAAIRPETRGILVEIIGNPKLDVVDVRGLAAIANQAGVPLIVDNTMTTPYLCQIRELGAHIGVNCMGKFLTGNGNAIGGIVVDLGTFDWKNSRSERIQEWSRKVGKMAFLTVMRKLVTVNTGACLSPFNAYLFLMGLEALAVRMDRHVINATALATHLASHLAVCHVSYPALPGSGFEDLVKTQFGGRGGALLTIRLGSKEKAYLFLNALKLVTIAANLGDARTLAIHPASTIYRDFSESEQQASGVYVDMVRVSVGLESIQDLFHDFDQALRVIQGSSMKNAIGETHA
jgi:O-acetylhomoserine (thiol)-lyase